MIVNENLKDVNKIDDLEGLKCAYVAGSNSGDLFKQLAKERNLNIDLQVFESGALMLEAFNQGKVNVFIAAENEGLARIKSGTIKARIADETINYVAEAYPFIKGDKKSQEINKIASDCIKAVSYTHLDVYKRQLFISYILIFINYFQNFLYFLLSL